jgi:hypothetical protein
VKIYLAGPMRGIPEFNFPAFHRAAAKLRAAGHEVFSPAEADIKVYGKDISQGNETGSEAKVEAEHGVTIRDCMKRDAVWICDEGEAICMLPGWQNSKGAKAEKALMEAVNGQILYYDQPYTWDPEYKRKRDAKEDDCRG